MIARISTFFAIFVANALLWEAPHGGYILIGLAGAAFVAGAAFAFWRPVETATYVALATAEYRRRDDVLISRMQYVAGGEALGAPLGAEQRVLEQLNQQRESVMMTDLQDAVGDSMPHVIITVQWPGGGSTTLDVDFDTNSVNGSTRGIAGFVFDEDVPWRGNPAAAET